MNGLSMHMWSSRETTNTGPGGCFWSDCWQPQFSLKSWSWGATMSLFEQQWQTYRTVLDHDSMVHKAVADAAVAAFWSWCDQRRDRDASAALVDLGCGDLAHLAPLYRSLPLSSYIGLDLTASVLPLAESRWDGQGFPVVGFMAICSIGPRRKQRLRWI